LESCAFGGSVGRAAVLDEAGGFTAPVDDPTAIDVGFGSTTIPSDDELDASAAWDCELLAATDVEVETEVAREDAGGAAELALVVAVVAVVDAVVAVVAAALVCTAFVVVVGWFPRLLPGHNARMPKSFWKTPMMLVSPTSTSLHALLTSSPTANRPLTHSDEQRVLGRKSLGVQPAMVAL
jgi:hypothetical protein